MNVVDVHSYRPKRTCHILERIALWQLLCVFVTVMLIWSIEIEKHKKQGRFARPLAAACESAATPTVIVLFAGLAAVLPVYLYHRRYAHKLVTICSYCRRVQVDDEDWTAIETYFADKTHATYSHGVCPVCQERVMMAYKTSHVTASAPEIPAATPAV